MIHWLGADNTTTYESDNQSGFKWYTELGWEAIVGRLKVIRMVSDGRIGKDDVIVTVPDRMFFYSKFCQVRPYEPGMELKDVGMNPWGYGDWLNELHVSAGKYVSWRWPQDMGLIAAFDYEPVDPPPCAVVQHRVRKWVSNRNCKEADTRALVDAIIDAGLKPYISGRHAESVDPRAEHVPTLRRLASIIHHPNCTAFFATGGPAMMAQQCCRNKLVCLDTCGVKADRTNHPLYFSPLLNLSGHERHVIYPTEIDEARRLLAE